MDVQSLFLTYTMDVASGFFMGHCVGGLDQLLAGDEDENETDLGRAGENFGPVKDVVEGKEGEVTGEELTRAFAEAQVSLV